MISLLYFHQFSHWCLRMCDRCTYIYIYIYQHRIVHGLRMNIFTNIGFVRCRGLCGAEVYGPRRKKKEHSHFHSIRYQIATLMLENSNKINLFYFQESAQCLKKKHRILNFFQPISHVFPTPLFKPPFPPFFFPSLSQFLLCHARNSLIHSIYYFTQNKFFFNTYCSLPTKILKRLLLFFSPSPSLTF